MDPAVRFLKPPYELQLVLGTVRHCRALTWSEYITVRQSNKVLEISVSDINQNNRTVGIISRSRGSSEEHSSKYDDQPQKTCS